MAHKANPVPKFILPTAIFGPVEVRRLQRELENLEDYMMAAAIRTPGKEIRMPKTSQLLDTIAIENKMNLLVAKDRKTLDVAFRAILVHAPVVHISFAVDPSAAFTGKIVSWFRKHSHPQTLLHVGLQPNIAAGCVMRTPNRAFDFSLRHRFDLQKDLLTAELTKEAK